MYLTLTNETANVILEGREQVAALKAKVSIPKNSIISASWQPTFKDWRSWEVRMPGSYLPKRLLAGSFWTEDGWDFVYSLKPHSGLTRPQLSNVLVLETDLNRYRRVIIGIDKAEAQKLIKWWQEGA